MITVDMLEQMSNHVGGTEHVMLIAAAAICERLDALKVSAPPARTDQEDDTEEQRFSEILGALEALEEQALAAGEVELAETISAVHLTHVTGQLAPLHSWASRYVAAIRRILVTDYEAQNPKKPTDNEQASPPPPKGEPPLSQPEADQLRAELAAARADASRLWSVLGGVMEVIRHSTGVAGWRHDGNIQPWEDFTTIEAAREALATRAPKGSQLLRLLELFAERADAAGGSSSPTGRAWIDSYNILRSVINQKPEKETS